MTPKELAQAVTSYTTTPWTKVKVLYVDDRLGLVKWPGGYEGRHFCRSWISPWVYLYDFSEPNWRYMGRIVWESNVNGKLTTKRIADLIQRTLDIRT